MAECAKPGCEREVAHGVLACRPHWYELPAEMRRDINRTWGLRRNAGRSLREIATEHRNMKIAAVAFWTE